MVIYMERGAGLHMAQLMPLPLTVSCFSKIQIGFTFLVPAHPGSPGQRAVKRVCVCVCTFSYSLAHVVRLACVGGRSHNITLINKTKSLNDTDFIIRMLYKYSY